MRQQRLLERAPRERLLTVVSALGGLHAQLGSAAEMALWARVEGVSAGDVADLLWRERSLVKAWMMRGTLHLVAAEDFPLYVGALRTLRHFRRPSWLKHHGVTLEQLEAIVEGVGEVLGGEGMTRQELAAALVDRLGDPGLEELLLSGWSALLKPAAFQGHIAHGPDEGQNVTFVRPADWLGAWEVWESEAALAEIARRYLTAYGPATVDEFSRWLGVTPSQARKTFRALGEVAVAVDVEGREAWAPAALVALEAALPAPRTVRLLPYFDPYVVAVYRHREHLLPAAGAKKVYRSQGWIYPAVLVDGRLEGVWGYERGEGRMEIEVELFGRDGERVRAGIAAGAESLGRFLGVEVNVEYVDELGG